MSDECPFTDDPYGTAIANIRATIAHALEHGGAMSEGEHANLIAIEEFVRSRDNA